MKHSFFSDKKYWFKGNTHAHTTRTDGTCPPDKQVQDYSERGYDFLAITDHNVVDSYQEKKGICMLPGWERDVRHNEENTSCIHVIGLFPADA